MSVALTDEKSIPLFQDLARDHPPDGHDVCPLSAESDETIWPSGDHRDRQASVLSCGDESHRECRPPGDRVLAQQSGREFTSAIPTTRTSDGEIQECKVASEVCLDPRFSPQSLLPGTSFLQPRKLQTQSFRRLGGVASTCDLRSTDDGVLLTGSISPDNAP